MVFGEDGVMRGEGVKKGNERVKTQLFDSEVRGMMKGNAEIAECSKLVVQCTIYEPWTYCFMKFHGFCCLEPKF